MIRVYAAEAGSCIVSELADDKVLPANSVVWIDLLNPMGEEERRIESLFGVDVPTREEMREIETSSRLYRQDGATYMTAMVITNAYSEHPISSAVTFVLTPRALVTLRYDEPLSFRTFAAQVQRSPDICSSPETAFVSLIDTIVDRVADILEKVGSDLEALSHEVFAAGKKSKDFEAKLSHLGRSGDVISKARESLISLSRLAAFANQSPQIRNHETVREALSVIGGDIASLNEHLGFLSSKVTFLLDAVLGMINVQQNAIIKIFSVVAVVFLPPTLIASIYGMNFQHMPELSWLFGYPMALFAMLVSMIVPYLLFKFKGWL